MLGCPWLMSSPSSVRAPLLQHALQQPRCIHHPQPRSHPLPPTLLAHVTVPLKMYPVATAVSSVALTT